jgi:hypothetical protein
LTAWDRLAIRDSIALKVQVPRTMAVSVIGYYVVACRLGWGTRLGDPSRCSRDRLAADAVRRDLVVNALVPPVDRIVIAMKAAR